MSIHNKHIDALPILLLTSYGVILPFGVAILPEYEILTISAMWLSLALCLLNICRTKHTISITLTDIVVILWYIYDVLNMIIIRNNQVDSLIYYQWAVWGMIYIIARQVKDAHLLWLLYALSLSGVIQSIVGLLQYINVISNNWYSDFKVTGCFGNPGPWGGYLSVTFIATSCLFLRKKRLLWRTGTTIALLLIGLMLIYADSRAAWLATLVALLYLGSHLGLQKFCYKRMFLVTLAVFVMIIVTGLYFYKPVSADSRLLIWRNSYAMFSDAPICGHGVGSFAMKHMTYQADYFEQYPESRFASLADNNTRAFNELIAVFCEQGMIGGILVLFIIGMAFLCKRSVGLKSIFLSVCVFACFSYSGDILPLSILFFLCIGLLPGKVMMRFRMRKAVTISLLVLLASICIYFSIGFRRHYRQAFEQLKKDEPQLVLPYNKQYMSRYLKLLLERKRWKEFIYWSTNTDFPFVTSTLQCDIGKSYMQLGKAELAEQALKKAYWMVPSKVLSRYFLFLLYRDTGRHSDARRMAEEIVTMKVSQIGSVYLSARTEARSFLEADSNIQPSLSP
ncbi:O-antigen ligase family protein [Bacteroides congonensis]|uniref:O-antigen ligase family protein n=1 Tax=Bacteroides congonensis TaxID=1871006 RepID=UPI002FD98698